MSKKALSHEAALEEMHNFLSIWKDDEEYTDDKVKEDYPDALQALQEGRLVFEEESMKPKYTLKHPIEKKEGETVLAEVEFKTRIKPSTQAALADGLKLETQALRYGLKVISFIIGQPIAYIDLMHKKDYKTISEITSVFS